MCGGGARNEGELFVSDNKSTQQNNSSKLFSVSHLASGVLSPWMKIDQI